MCHLYHRFSLNQLESLSNYTTKNLPVSLFFYKIIGSRIFLATNEEVSVITMILDFFVGFFNERASRQKKKTDFLSIKSQKYPCMQPKSQPGVITHKHNKYQRWGAMLSDPSITVCLSPKSVANGPTCHHLIHLSYLQARYACYTFPHSNFN